MELACALNELRRSQAAWVVCGHSPHLADKEGNVDLWAAQITRELSIDLLEYRLDGYRWVNGQRRASWGSRHPLARNRAMVTHCEQALQKGWAVRCLALVAPWSRTHGTEHTAGLAERAGIHTTRQRWTAEESE